MGTTLGSLHIFMDEHEYIKPLLNSQYCTLSISEGWVSVLGDDMSDMEKGARVISKVDDVPVLSFFCFDDDLMVIQLFQKGRETARYAMICAGESYLKNAKVFLTALDFEPSLEKRFRTILKCNNLTQKVDMLEEFFGVALYIHPDFVIDGTDGYVRTRGDAFYRIYEAQQKKLSKIRNRTKAVLTQEMDAKIEPFNNMPLPTTSRYFTAIQRDEDGKHVRYMMELIGDTCQRLIREIASNSKLYLSRDVWTICNTSLGVENEMVYRCCHIAKDRPKVEEAHLPLWFEVAAVCENKDMLCFRGIEPNQTNPDNLVTRIAMVGTGGEIKWSIQESLWVNYHLFLHNKLIYIVKDNSQLKRESQILKLDLDGHVLAETRMPYCGTRSMEFADGYIFYLAKWVDQHKWKNVLYKFDDSLNVVGTLELPPELSVFDSAEIDRQNQKMYYNTLDKEAVTIDLDTLAYRVTKLEADVRIVLSDQMGLVYGLLGYSTVCVFDSTLRTISRHRLKGWVFSICKTDTGVHVVTGTGDREIWDNKVNSSCTVRVYRIDPA